MSTLYLMKKSVNHAGDAIIFAGKKQFTQRSIVMSHIHRNRLRMSGRKWRYLVPRPSLHNVGNIVFTMRQHTCVFSSIQSECKEEYIEIVYIEKNSGMNVP